MDVTDFNMYYSDTVHEHVELGPIQIYGYNTDEDCVNFRKVGAERGTEMVISVDEFRNKLSQPKLSHYAQNKAVMWPFQRGDRYYKKGLHSDRVCDVTLTSRLAKTYPSTYDKIRDIIAQRKYHSLRNISSRIERDGVVCISNDNLDHICILNETNATARLPEFYFGPRKIEEDQLFGMIKFFAGRPFDILLDPHYSTHGATLGKYHVMIKDKLIDILRSKSLNDNGQRVLLNLLQGKYDTSIAGIGEEILKDAQAFFEPDEPVITTKCFYKSIWLMDIGGKRNEDLNDIPFFMDMMDVINREYN